jgi:hypothetical protein
MAVGFETFYLALRSNRPEPMFQTHQRCNNWFFKLPVLILYLAFLGVQIFFNLDIAQKTITSERTVIVKGANEHIGKIKQDKSKSFPTKKVRLNKRFQPSTTPDFIAELLPAPIVYARSKPTALSHGNLYSFIYNSSHALRGPPVNA